MELVKSSSGEYQLYVGDSDAMVFIRKIAGC